jgi:hypothetical protein
MLLLGPEETTDTIHYVPGRQSRYRGVSVN